MDLISLTVPTVLDAEGLARLERQLLTALSSPERQGIALVGEPGVFCQGLSLMEPHTEPLQPLLERFARLLLTVRGAACPTLALVEGQALGGGLGLAAACDWVLAGPRARFGLPEALVGLVPAMVMPIVAERMGAAAARRMALMAASVDDSEAQRLGLVDLRCTDPLAAARQQLRHLRRAAPSSVSWLKRTPADLTAAVLDGARETAERLSDPTVRSAIRALSEGEAPWAICS